ncbi:hypothetical protein BDN70DRAFT_927435 [Pholiota conissans]|uniref:Uncharacterized protein n=1 Tax=Pholiota conissans TaxID=109636 RepID=A0A9P5ZD38_9AGAR|nr:hypothetical protein BDN70DRAFT_927435 [Pholiota conissans]
MPLIEEVDDVDAVLEVEPDMDDLLTQLTIPPDYSRSEYIAENPIPELEKWKAKTTSVLRDILRIVKAKEAGDLTLEARGNLVFAVAPFAPRSSKRELEDDRTRLPEPWVKEADEEIAEDILCLPQLAPSRELITQVLTNNLKPIFKANPHPRLNTETGRKVAGSAGGPAAMQDYYDGQRWKEYPGIGKVVLWCVRNIEEEDYEKIWHLVIPPTMTLLDDYEAKYKLQGLFVVEEMLIHVPGGLLKRTGIAGLLNQSLRTSLAHLQSPETAALMKHAIGASLSLILLTTSVSPGSTDPAERFNELSSLLGEGIISGIWLYAEDKPGVLLATFQALPPLFKALDIGSIRFLKSLMPQLTHSLIPIPLVEPDRELQLSALRALETLLDVCKPRIPSWRETILDAVGRCWVGLIDEERKGSSAGDINLRNEVKKSLQDFCVHLAQTCPSVTKDEYPRLLKADKDLFENLFSQVDGVEL